MIVTFRGSFLSLLAWQWRNALLFAASGLAASFAHARLGRAHWELPALPLTVAGAALGIFVSFRTNACYARWWEGRQLWGRLINTARNLASQLVCSLTREEAERLTRVTITYAHLLRCALRDQDPWSDVDVLAHCTEAQRARWRAEVNPCYAAAHELRAGVTAAANGGALHELRLHAMDATVGALLDVQGGCERIKKTPFPRAYGYIAERLIAAFGVLLPFAMVRPLGWGTAPMNVLVCGAFAMISEVGRVLEDPFTMFWNGLPLSAMSKTVEVNLLQRIGVADVPKVPTADARGVLM